MRFLDVLRLSLGSWRRQKTRFALTLLGVVLGACMLTISLSIGEGVKAAVREQFRKNDQLRRIVTHADYRQPEDESGIPPESIEVHGNMSAEKRARIRKELVANWHQQHGRKVLIPIDRPMLERLSAIEHVELVTPVIGEFGRCILGGRGRDVRIQSADFRAEGLQKRLVAGRMLQANNDPGILVHEMLLYELGVRDDSAVAALIGSKVALEVVNVQRGGPQVLIMFAPPSSVMSVEEAALLEKATELLPMALEHLELSAQEKQTLQRLIQRRGPTVPPPKRKTVRREFTVAGVIRILDRKEDLRWRFDDSYPYVDVVVAAETMQEFADLLPRRQETGYDSAIVRVDREENVRPVIEEIKKTGLAHYSAADFVDSVLREVRLIRYFTGVIALVALLVAAIGITNTMVTSVLERIQEIGIMKAVGARDRHILSIFLIEGALIGLLGSLLGLCVSWLVSIPGDHYGRKIMEQQMQDSVTLPIFVFPAWLLLSIPLFATAVTTLAALYPARRAARIDPVAALRHE